jgi:predicted RNA binding protein YcfA (HicA-like mRNA interferase family)
MARPFDLLERMRRSKAGWHERDLKELYEGFGFVRVEGSNHILYKHPKYPDLRATVSRSSHLKVGYFSTAVRTIDKLLEREKEEQST